jgi:hypothetical protein
LTVDPRDDLIAGVLRRRRNHAALHGAWYAASPARRGV